VQEDIQGTGSCLGNFSLLEILSRMNVLSTLIIHKKWNIENVFQMHFLKRASLIVFRVLIYYAHPFLITFHLKSPQYN
jgi:hypothetical protein